MKKRNFLFNLEYQGGEINPEVKTNITTEKIPFDVRLAIDKFASIEKCTRISVLKFQYLKYEIKIREKKITIKSIYRWECAYKQTK